jgi:hypothetical protein
MSSGSPDFYKAIVGVANKKCLITPALVVKKRENGCRGIKNYVTSFMYDSEAKI